jgi:tetratricopeptide (TPR) repeat protein
MRRKLAFSMIGVALLGAFVHAREPSTAALIEDGHYKRARVILHDRLKANPNDARSLCEMSKVAEAFGSWDEAISQADKAVSLDRKNAEFQAALADALGSKLSSAHLGMFAQASLAHRFKKEAELALELDPNNVEANEDLMEFHLDAPALVGGDKKKAAELAERMVQVNPVRGYLMKIEFATHEKNRGELESLFQQAIRAGPTNYYVRVQAANYYLEKGGIYLGQAEEQARQAIEINPSRIGAYITLAMLYVEQGHWKDLDSVLESSERAVSDDLTPFYQAAKSIFTGNRAEELTRAEKYVHLYLSQAPEGNEPSEAAAHWRLGLILEKEGHKAQAREELRQAVSLDPEFEPAKQDLKRFE